MCSLFSNTVYIVHVKFTLRNALKNYVLQTHSFALILTHFKIVLQCKNNSRMDRIISTLCSITKNGAI